MIEEEYRNINYMGLDLTISNFGKVIWNDKERNTYLNKDGYIVVTLKIPNKGWRSIGVHILVATAFIPNPNNLPEVNHLDFNRKNPRVDNLEWITHADNIRYSVCNMPDYHGKNNPNYGNTILSKKYKENKILSKEKQSRPATQNGRSTPIDLYYDDKFIKSFDYIIPCCQYLIDIGVSNVKSPECVRTQLNKCIRENRKYKKHYSFIKK